MAETCQDLSSEVGTLPLESSDHFVSVKGMGEAFQWTPKGSCYSHSGCYLESTVRRGCSEGEETGQPRSRQRW